MTEFADNIRRIAKGTRQKGALGSYQEREPVLGGSVTLVTNSYQVGGETPTSTAPNSPTQQEENGDEQAATDENNPNSFYKGGAGTSTSTETATTQGSQDIDDVMNGTAGPQTSPDPDGSTPTDYQTGLSGLTGLTDKDGNCFKVRMDGTFPTPEGWEDPDSPPVEQFYEDGHYWQTQAIYGSVGVSNYPFGALEDRGYSRIDGSVSQEEEDDGFGGTRVRISSSVSCGIKFGGGCFTSILVYKNNCPGPNAETLAACEADPPTEEAWPDDDGCYVLAYKDGKFQTNQYDPNAPAGWNPKSTVYDYDGSAAKYGITGTANGGYMVYDTNSDGSANSNGTARVYGPDGSAQAFGNPTPQFMDQYLPK